MIRRMPISAFRRASASPVDGNVVRLDRVAKKLRAL
jgi:hypothetical protein